MTVAARAVQRFARLRAEAAAGIADGSLHDVLAAPPSPPGGWCVALVARVIRQPEAQAVLDRIGEMLDDLGAGVWRYPDESMHISAVALTGREAEPIDDVRTGRLVAALPVALRPHLTGGPFGFELGGLGLVGAQLFVEVVPTDDRWPRLRAAVLDLAEASGERPIRHDDLEPIHLNVARLAGGDVDLERLTDRIDTDRAPTVPFTVSELELVLTDFVVSPGATIHLSHSTTDPR